MDIFLLYTFALTSYIVVFLPPAQELEKLYWNNWRHAGFPICHIFCIDYMLAKNKMSLLQYINLNVDIDLY